MQKQVLIPTITAFAIYSWPFLIVLRMSYKFFFPTLQASLTLISSYLQLAARNSGQELCSLIKFEYNNPDFLKNSQVQISKLNEKNPDYLLIKLNMRKNYVEEVPGDLSWSHYFSFKKAFSMVSGAQNFRYHFTRYHCFRKFPVLIQNYDV